MRDTRIEVDADLPIVRVARDFHALRHWVYQAWIDPAQVAQWLGPQGVSVRASTWDALTGGSYRYSAWREGEEFASFYGSFHELRPDERLVRTFAYDGMPDAVCLETVTFIDLGDGHTRVNSLLAFDAMAARDAMIANGMEGGVVEGYQKLDDLLVEG